MWWTHYLGWSQWLHRLRLGSATARLLRSCFRIPLRHGCLSLVSFMCCQVEVSARGPSLVQTSPTEYICVALSVLKCHSNPLHLQWVGRKRSILSKTERLELYMVNTLMLLTYLRLMYYDKGYQQMPLSFVIFLYLHVSSLHVSGFYQPIIRGIPSCCLCATTWFM